MKVTLSLTHLCNLSCRYCYSGRKFKKDISLATAQKIVDFAVDIAPPEREIELSFFGGEPLLRFDLIEDIVGYIRKKERNPGKTFCLSVTSNGTLLTPAILDFFKDEDIDLCISIDGPEHVHNLNRCYEDGRGSFEEVLRNLRLAIEELETLQVNAVFGPDTIDFLPESVSFFAELGISAIHLNLNICASWDESTYPKLQETYMKVADYYIQSYQKGQEIAVNLMDSKIIVFLKGGYEQKR